MHKPTLLFAAVAISSALPTAAFAQTAGQDHAHGQPPAAAQPTTPPDQHGQQTRPGNPASGDHQADCNCSCCQMMRQMMMEMHGAHGQSAPAAPAAAPSEHQGHEAQRPN
jgi:hypothetical protein